MLINKNKAIKYNYIFKELSIEVSHKKIKNLILKIYKNGEIKLSVPLNTSEKRINDFLSSRKSWIDLKLKNIEEEKKRKNKNNLIKFFGKDLEIVISIKDKEENAYIYENKIYLFLNNIENLDNILLKTKVKYLKIELDYYLEKYINLLDTKVDKYVIKDLKTAWGIYHKRKNYISFNINLVEQRKEFIEYVVLHELCHTFVMNHQKEFWDLVEKYMPNYKELKKCY